MLKIVPVIFALIAVGIAGVLAYAATRPDTSRITRSALVQAAPDTIFPLINDLTVWKG